MNASSSETVSYLDKLASVVRVLCDRDLVSFAMTPMVVGIQSSELGLEQVNFSKKVCLGDSDFYTLATVFKSALMYLSLIIASAGTAIETTVVPTHADAPSSAAKLLYDPLNRNFSVHNSVLNTLAFSRSRDPLSGQLWGLLLRHFGSSGVWTEALAVHDDCHLNQIQRLRMTATGDAPSVISSSSRRDSSSNSYLMLESAAQNAGITVNELCVGASNVFTLFCAVYLHQLAATDDEELFSSTHSLSSQDLQLLVVVLKEHLNKLFVSSYLPFDLDKDTKQTARNKLLLDRLFRQTTFVKLWGALYARNERRPFYPQQFWQVIYIFVIYVHLYEYVCNSFIFEDGNFKYICISICLIVGWRCGSCA